MADEIKDFQIKIITSADLKAAQDSAKALGEIGDSATQSGKVQVDANEKVEPAQERVAGNWGKIKKAMQEVGREFPIIGAAARTFFNPLALAAAAVTLIFQKLKGDIDRLNESLTSSTWEGYAGVLNEQNKAMQDAALGAAAMERQMERLGTATQTASAASERLMTVFKASMSAQDQLDAARKGLEVARMEAGEQDPVKRQEKLLEIEERYAAQKRARDESGARFEIEEQKRRMAAEGETVQRVGKAIKTAQKRQEGLKSEAEITEQLRVERGRLAAIDEERGKKQERYDELSSKWLLTIPQQMEQQSLWGQLESLGAQKTRQSALVGRLEAAAPSGISNWRASQENLAALEQMRQSAAERGLTIAANLPAQERVAGIESATRGTVGQLETSTRVAQALAASQQRQRQAEDVILKAIESGTGFSAKALQEIQDQRRFANELERRLGLLEGAQKMHRVPGI